MSKYSKKIMKFLEFSVFFATISFNLSIILR